MTYREEMMSSSVPVIHHLLSTSHSSSAFYQSFVICCLPSHYLSTSHRSPHRHSLSHPHLYQSFITSPEWSDVLDSFPVFDCKESNTCTDRYRLEGRHQLYCTVQLCRNSTHLLVPPHPLIVLIIPQDLLQVP